jgi:hypothetical protein
MLRLVNQTNLALQFTNYNYDVITKVTISFYSPFSENEDKKLWDPDSLPNESVEDYLAKSEESLQTTGVVSLPLGAHIRDDEQVKNLFDNLSD